MAYAPLWWPRVSFPKSPSFGPSPVLHALSGDVGDDLIYPLALVCLPRMLDSRSRGSGGGGKGLTSSNAAT